MVSFVKVQRRGRPSLRKKRKQMYPNPGTKPSPSKEHAVTGTVWSNFDIADGGDEHTVQHRGQGKERDELLRLQHYLRLQVLENAEQTFEQNPLKAPKERSTEPTQTLIRAYQDFFKHQPDSRNCARDLRQLLEHAAEQSGTTTSDIIGVAQSAGQSPYKHFGDTYVSHDGVAILGDVDCRTTNKTTIHAVRDKRSRLEALVVSLLGGAAGGAIVHYSAASSCKGDGNAQSTATAVSTTTRLPSPDPWHSEIVSLGDTSSTSALPREGALAHFSSSASATTTPHIPPRYQLNCCERVYPVCYMARKPRVSRTAQALMYTAVSKRKTVLILRLSAARTTRYHFLVQKLTSCCDVVIIDDVKKALATINDPTWPPDVVLVYDKSILAASEDPSSLAGQFLTCLARFACNGGTAVFGPHCDKSIEFRSIANLFIEFWALQQELAVDSSNTHFLVSSALARRLAAALSYYFRAVAKRLRAPPDDDDSMSVTSHTGEHSTLKHVQGPRHRSASERLLAFVERGQGKVGFLGKVGSKQDTCRIIFAMLDLPW